MAKILNFDSFGGCIPTLLPYNGEIGRVDISRLSGQRVAPAERKTYFWTTE